MRHPTALLCALLIVASTAKAADCVPPIFKTPQEYAAAEGAISVASGDFNGDGIADLAVANLRSNNISVLLGDGVGGFGPPTNFAVAREPASVAVGDFNKDGKADVAVGHFFGGGPISVLFGDGAGRLSTPSVISGISGPNRVAVGDFNGDTNPDIAVGTFSGAAHVLLGNGAGSFSARQIATGGDSRNLTTGEFNGDGITDLAFATSGGLNEVVIVPGNSAGAFATGFRITLDQTPLAITARDFDGNARDDIVVTVQHFEPRLHFLRNNGAGGFSVTAVLRVGQSPSTVAAGDFTGDGKTDIAIGASGIRIFAGNGLAGFETPQTTYLTGRGPQALLPGDFNADGRTDLVTANFNNPGTFSPGTGSVSVLLGGGPAAFDTSRGLDLGAPPLALAVGDFNRDGASDLAASFFNSSHFVVSLGDGTGGLLDQTVFFGERNPASLAIADFNADGAVDLATANDLSGSVSVFFGSGLGRFAGFINVPGFASHVAAGNFNGDGRADLVVSTSSGGVRVLLSNASNGFDLAPGSPFNAARNLAVGDFNGDGLSDLAAAADAQGNLLILLNDGTGRMTAASATPIPGGSNNEELRLTAADLNRDGRADVVLANGGTRKVVVFIGDGAGGLGAGTNFEPGVSTAISYRPLDVTAADFDGDGNPDVAVANNDFAGLGDVSVLLGDGAGGLKPPFAYPSGGNPSRLAAGDFNRDAKPDLAVINGNGHSAMVLLNVFAPHPCLSVSDATLTEGDAGTQNAVFNVTLSEASAQTVRVNYSIRALTASAGADYTPVSGRLVFLPGETTKSVSVPVAADALDESDETFELTLASPSHAALADATGLGTVADDDPLPTLSVNDVSLPEDLFNSDAGVFRVRLSAPSGRDVSVQLEVVGGTATPGRDFGSFSRTVTIPAGQTSADVRVGVVQDNTFEPDETFFVNLSSPTNAAIADAQGQGTIVNDDPAPTINFDNGLVEEGNSGQTQMFFGVRLSNPTSLPVTVNFATSDGTATAGIDYVAASGTLTFAPEESLKSVIVMINGDTIDETDETLNLTLSGATNATLTETQEPGFIVDDDGPTISISDVRVTEGNGGTTDAGFTVTLSAPSPDNVVVNFATADGTATGVLTTGGDYQRRNANIVIFAGVTAATFVVRVNGDTAVEPDETFFVNLSNPRRATLADAQGVGTIINDDSSVQSGAAAISTWEASGAAQVVITRAGLLSDSCSVKYRTANGTASDRSDYNLALGTLSFAPNEASKTVNLFITNDALVEAPETFSLMLSDPVGCTVGSPGSVVITINSDDAAAGPNPADATEFFVRQHYRDFLNRDPDAAGLAHWTNVIEECGSDAQCREVHRINVSGAFFLSIEFKETGYLVERIYKAAYGDATGTSTLGGTTHQLTVPVVRLEEFLPDTQMIGKGVVVNQGEWQAQLEANKQAFMLEFVQRRRFLDAFPLSLTPAEFVDRLNGRAGGPLDASERQALIDELTANNTTAGRASVLREVAEDPTLEEAEKNRAFVLMQYFGYLRRNPDDTPDADYTGYDFWLGNLNRFSGNFVQAELVKAFISSTEYRQRFGQ